MKTKISICFFLFCFSGKSFCQSFELELAPNVNSYINLYEENKFVITLVYQATNDILYTNLISFGSFSSQKDELILQDKINGYIIRVQQRYNLSDKVRGEKFLYVKNGFNWMKNKFYNQTNSPPNKIELDNIKDIEKITKRIVIKHQREWSKNGTNLFIGSYYSENYPHFFLRLENNGKYHIEFWGINLSFGKWETNRNLLILKDMNVDVNFYLEIKQDSLSIINIIPLDFTSGLLFYIK